jgi:hypothetical protein
MQLLGTAATEAEADRLEARWIDELTAGGHPLKNRRYSRGKMFAAARDAMTAAVRRRTLSWCRHRRHRPAVPFRYRSG